MGATSAAKRYCHHRGKHYVAMSEVQQEGPLMTDTSNAIMAAYFEFGIAVGILAADDTMSWAFAIIAIKDNPPGDIIEIAMSGSTDELLSKLRSAAGERDYKQAGQC